MTDQFYEMQWDCTRCGSAKLLGKTHRFCPGCGAPQDPEARYFPEPGEEVAVADHQFVGKDKMCPYCEAPAAAAAANCGVCGGALDGSKEAGTRSEQMSDTAGNFGADSARQAKVDHREQRHGGETPAGDPRQPPPPTDGGGSSGGGGGPGKWILLAVVALVLIGGGVLAMNALWKKDIKLSVVEHSWQRTIAIEQLKNVRESAWCDKMPRNVRVLNRSHEVRDHKRVRDGETCRSVRKDMGDGTFKQQQKCEPKYRKEPIYAERCSYEARRWQVASQKVARGQGVTPAPQWPDLPQLNTGNCLGCERPGKKVARYVVKLKAIDQSDEFTCNLPEQAWRDLSGKATIAAQMGGVLGNVDCDSLGLGATAQASES